MSADDTTPTGPDTTTGATGTDSGGAELLPALWPGSTAQVHGPGTGKYTDAIVRVLSDRGRRWTVETSDGTRLKIDPVMLRETDQPFVSTAPAYVPGSVVTVTPPVAPHPAGQRFVVTAVRVPYLTVAKLGGEAGTTYRVSPAACRPADPDA